MRLRPASVTRTENIFQMKPQRQQLCDDITYDFQCNFIETVLLVKYFIALWVEINKSRITWNEPIISATGRAFWSVFCLMATSNYFQK